MVIFEKQLETYIYQQQTVESFVGYPYTGATPPIINYGLGSQYVNGSGGNMSGVEANVQLGSEVFTGGTIQGFGIQLNGAVIDSSIRSEEHTSELQSLRHLVCRLLLEKKQKLCYQARSA